MLNDDISKYLTMGFVNDLDYGEIHELKYIPFDEAKVKFREILRDAISELTPRKSAFATTGGLNSASILHYENGPHINTFGFTGKWSNQLAEYYKTAHHLSDFSNIENDLIEMHRLWDTPHLGTVGDVFVYNRMKKIKESGLIYDVCEGGPEWLLLSYVFMYPEMVGLIAKKLEYNFALSKSIVGCSRYNKTTSMPLGKALLVDPSIPYIDLYIKCYQTFSDVEIQKFGYTPSVYELKQDTLLHLIQATVDWIAPNRLTSKTFAKKFGIEIVSPYFTNEKMIDFCLSLPVEYRYCYGNKKHILRESIGKLIPEFILNIRDFDPNGNNFSRIEYQIALLIEKYLKSKDRRLFNYLDYNLVQDIKEFRKIWHLLNLSIWLEIHDV